MVQFSRFKSTETTCLVAFAVAILTIPTLCDSQTPQSASRLPNADPYTLCHNRKPSGSRFHVLINAPASGSSVSTAKINKTNSLLPGVPTYTLLWSDVNPIRVGESTTFSAQVVGSTSPPPGGTITFDDGSGSIGTNSVSTVTNTNYLLYSSQFDNAAWGLYGDASITSDYATSPAGGETAYRFQSSDGDGDLEQTVLGLPGSQPVTFSLWLRSNSVDDQPLQIWMEDADGSGAHVNATCVASAAWRRCSVTLPTNSVDVWVALFNDQYHPAGWDVSIWGAQLQTSAPVGPYVDTAGAPVTGTSSVAALQTTSLDSGSRSITANYSGDDNNEGSTSAALTENVTLLEITTFSPIVNGLQLTPYSSTLTAVGATPPYSWSIVGALPDGLSLDSSTGVISGTPTGDDGWTEGSFIAQVTDSSDPAIVAPKEFAMEILGPNACLMMRRKPVDPSCPGSPPVIHGIYPNEGFTGLDGQTFAIYGCVLPDDNGDMGTLTVNAPPGFTKTGQSVVGLYMVEIDETVNIAHDAPTGAEGITVTQDVTGCSSGKSNTLMFYVAPGKPSVSGPNTVWWFSGHNPDGTDYPTSITLTSDAGASTTWRVVQEDGKVNLSTTSGASVTITPTGTYFSGTAGDISVYADANGQESAAFTITAKSPWKLTPYLPVTVCDPTYTYVTDLTYDLEDQFEGIMSYPIDWNESVGACVSENGSNWGPICIDTSPGSTGPLLDSLAGPQLTYSPTPSPQCNLPPAGTTEYEEVPQSIYVGSSDTGAGVLVQTDILTYYIDQGKHTSITSPDPPQD